MIEKEQVMVTIRILTKKERELDAIVKFHNIKNGSSVDWGVAIRTDAKTLK